VEIRREAVGNIRSVDGRKKHGRRERIFIWGECLMFFSIRSLLLMNLNLEDEYCNNLEGENRLSVCCKTEATQGNQVSR